MGKRTGQRERLVCDSVQSKLSANPKERFLVRMDLQSCPALRVSGLHPTLISYQLWDNIGRKHNLRQFFFTFLIGGHLQQDCQLRAILQNSHRAGSKAYLTQQDTKRGSESQPSPSTFSCFLQHEFLFIF